MKLLTITILVLLMSTTVEARNRWFGRRHRAPSCSNGTCQPAQRVAPTVAPVVPLVPPVVDPVPTVEPEAAVKPIPDSSVLATANRKRVARGLPPFRWDARLQRNVDQKAAIQAGQLYVSHDGGTMAGASGEGVGGSGSAQDFCACYLYGTHQTAAAASQQGRNGKWFHVLQVSGPGNGNNGGTRRRRLFR